MLARAVRAEAGPQIGFLRADAQRLPLRDETVDAVVSIAVLQLVPDPAAALAEMARVLRPGGRLAVMVPTAGRAARFWRMYRTLGPICSAKTNSATPGGPRLRQRTDEEFRPYSVCAGQTRVTLRR